MLGSSDVGHWEIMFTSESMNQLKFALVKQHFELQLADLSRAPKCYFKGAWKTGQLLLDGEGPSSMQVVRSRMAPHRD